MSKTVRVDPIELRMASDHVVDAADEYRQASTRHLDDFTDGVGRWRGDASKAAMQEAADRWGSQHTAHHQRASALGDNVGEAGQRFVAADDDSGAAVGNSLEL